MFQNWNFLIVEIFVLLLLAAIIGLLLAWFLFGRGQKAENESLAQAMSAQARAPKADTLASSAAMASTASTEEAAHDAKIDEASMSANYDYDGDGVVEGKNEGTKPATLTAPRDGKADNLKEIKGVGPKLEKLLHSLGFYHFDQIANWTKDELAWVDANLDGFHGRATRDEWVAQAKILAAGGETEFSKRVDDGKVY